MNAVCHNLGSEIMSDMNKMNGSTRRVIDFDIHGYVRIRLINPSASDVRALKKQLGPPDNSTLNQEPDISIRFEKHLELPNLTTLGRDEMGFTQDSFYVLKNKKASTKVKIPFESIGSRCEIVCESGLRAVPHLSTILNLTLLTKNCIPLHASAFVYKQAGILVTGWAKGGKTTALLSFLNRGAGYIGDDWVIVNKDGQEICGLQEPITLEEWHIKQLPSIRHEVKFSNLFFFKIIHLADFLYKHLRIGRLNNSFPTRILEKAMPILNQGLHITLQPEEIIDNESMTLRGKLNKIFFILKHNEPVISIESWKVEDIARRMLHALQYEQSHFFEHYKAFRFAFPELKNDFLESVPEIQKSLLFDALNGKDAYKVLHPSPVSMEELFRRLQPLCVK